MCFSYGLLKNETAIEDFGSAIRELNSTQTINFEVEQEPVEDEEHHVLCET